MDCKSSKIIWFYLRISHNFYNSNNGNQRYTEKTLSRFLWARWYSRADKPSNTDWQCRFSLDFHVPAKVASESREERCCKKTLDKSVAARMRISSSPDGSWGQMPSSRSCAKRGNSTCGKFMLSFFFFKKPISKISGQEPKRWWIYFTDR